MTTAITSVAYDDAAGNTTAVSAATPLPVTATGGTGTSANQVQGNVANDAVDAGNPVKVGGVANSAIPNAVAVGDRVNAWLGLTGATIIGGPLSAASDGISNATITGAANSLNGVVLPFWTANSVYNGTSWDREAKANGTSRIPTSANSTNATVGKNAAGTLHAISGYNSNAAVRYLKVYNKATAPTVGTDTPVLTIAIPATSAIPPTLLPMGLYFSAGISYALTTGAADADTGAVGAGDILGLNLAYS